MALGGGTFTAQNKVLPGAYVNFVSAFTVSDTLSERGYAAIGLELDWGEDGKIIEISASDFNVDCLKTFGYPQEHEKMKGIRDMMRNLVKLYAYKLTSGGQKATNTFATARCTGIRGNDIKISIQKNVDDTTAFDVQTILGTNVVDMQTVKTASELISNDFVDFKTDATLSVQASVPLTGGTNGEVDLASHQAFLDKVESYPSINALGYVGTNDAIKNLYVSFVKRMRDEVGIKLVGVIYNKPANYEGIVNVKNVADGEDIDESSLVYWVTGVIAGTAVNASATNVVYDGEYKINTDIKQIELERAIKNGEFTLHQVGNDIRVLSDINSLTTVTAEKGEDFKSNQTIRVLDQIATDIASIFVTKYLGVVPNDESGRSSLWNDIVMHHAQLETVRAIENFNEDDVQVAQGDNKKSVIVSDAVTIVNAMEKLYMTVKVA